MTVRAMALLLGACLAAPAFATGSGDRQQRAPAPEPETASAEGPILVSDPGSDATVLIWSRSDGATTKLAWARSTGAGWGPAHDLTFGPGLDLSPAVGISRTGSWLFWRGERGQIFSAPIDLSRGHLLAVPQTLAHGSGGGIRPEGGIDIPVIVRACDPTKPVMPCVPTGGSGPATRDLPPQINPEGGTDIPIIGTGGNGNPTSTTTTGAHLSVMSDSSCDSQFISLTQGRSILVLEFRGSGEIASQVRLRAGPGIDPAEAAAAAEDFFFRAACH